MIRFLISIFFKIRLLSVGSLLQLYLPWFLFMIFIILQKIIPLQEITAVRKAKMAGIFPNAIEIFVGEKKVVLSF